MSSAPLLSTPLNSPRTDARSFPRLTPDSLPSHRPAPPADDVVGWILLALAIALVNSSSSLVVLYVILTAVGWTLALWFVGRPVLKYLSRKTRSGGEGGPSQTMTAFTLFLVLTSAWLTDRIGMWVRFLLSPLGL